MDRLTQEIGAVRDALQPQWDEARSDRLYAALVGRRQRASRRRIAATGVVVAGAAVGAAAVGLLGVLGSNGQTPGHAPSKPKGVPVASQAAPAPSAAQAASEGTVRRAHRLRMADGSLAQLIGPHSELEIKRNEPGRVGLALHAGRAHFEVVRDAERTFEVEAGPYRVVVIGTIFDVERRSQQVNVEVERGRVRVYGPFGAQDLVAGQRQAFRLAPADTEVAPPSAKRKARKTGDARTDARRAASDKQHPPGDKRRAPNDEPARGASGPSWRSLSQSGDYDAAYESLRRGGQVDDEPGALMDAADAARLSGHPGSAVRYLARVVRDHADSPVAPLAAFTLGRVYLGRLGQPHQAAEAFARARALAPQGSLAQDALAREVEALSKGGEVQEANVRAREYLRRYPEGRRLRAVQRYGGLE